ncbi:MAG: tetratricopeptide repeat protein [Candidatus Eisenbacteria bacterium]
MEKRKSIPWLFAFVGIAFLLAHLAAASAYSNWLWGFNHYFFLPRIWSVVIIAAGCVLCLPPVWSRLIRVGRSWGRAARARHLNPVLCDLLVAGVIATLFWLLRAHYHFLGDGRLVIRLLDEGKWFHPIEPLDRIAHYGLLRATRSLLGWNAETVYAVLSIAAGFVYALTALRLGALFGKRVFVTAFLLTLGTVALFAGYAESYSLASAAIVVYMYVALQYLAGQRRFVWVGVTLLTGVALHFALTFLIPSFLYLLIARDHRPPVPGRRTVLSGVGFLALIAAMIAVALRYGRAGETAVVLVPWTPNPIAQYTLFSWQHLVDFLNEQVLISPLALLAAGWFVVAFWRSPSLRQSARFRFLMLAAAFPFLANLALRPGLGGSRDWDLWSMGSLPYAVAAAGWIASGLQGRVDVAPGTNRARSALFRSAAYIVLVVGAVHIVPWLAVNHSAQLSLDRFTCMLDRNPLWTGKRLAAAHNELAHFYLEKYEFTEAARELKRTVAIDPERARYWESLGVAYVGLGKAKEAESSMQRAVELDPNDASSLNSLGRLYLDTGRAAEAEATLNRALRVDPEYGPAHFNLGQLCAARGEPARAAAAYRRAAQAWPRSPTYWYNLAATLEAVPGNEKEAAEAWRRVVTLTEKDPSRRQMARDAASHLDRLERALAAQKPGRN